MVDIKNKRLDNIEVLRTLAMFMVVFWHSSSHFYSDHGLIVGKNIADIINYVLVQYSVILSSVAVNVYVLISGYFLLGKDFKSHRFIKVWFQTMFYSLLFCLAFLLFGKDGVSLTDIPKAFLVMRYDHYWFVTCYLGVILVAPFMRMVVERIPRNTYLKLLSVLLLVSTDFLLGYPFGDMLGFNLGYSFVWFVTLFFIVGYIKKYDIHLGKYNYISNYFIIGLIIFLYFLVRASLKVIFFGGQFEIQDLHYNSFPLILAVFLFIWFKNHTFTNNFCVKLFVKIAPYTFGVYLIHENVWVKSVLWHNVLWQNIMDKFNIPLPYMIFYCLFVFFVCSIKLDVCFSNILE